jgi:hypothetical protein
VQDAQVRSAREAVRAFAAAWVNWDWRKLAAQQRRLAGLATGRLAAELRANAKASAVDASPAQGRPSSRGNVVAIALHTRRSAASALVVTREQTYTAGHGDLGGQHHRVYRALLARGARGWEVTGWTRLP